MSGVQPKKWLGQHFLTDEHTASNIAALIPHDAKYVLEIGPGTGVLTKYLIKNNNFSYKVIEIDRESAQYLKQHYPELHIIEGDFLKTDLNQLFNEPFAIIGNFPYNISSQILFKAVDYLDLVQHLIGMFQKEVAERICANKGNKTYGILSVIVQAFYHTEYLFTVEPHSFYPPPKVRSGVIRLTRKTDTHPECYNPNYKRIIKAAFNQRRKTLRNALKGFVFEGVNEEIFSKRAEQLGVDDYVMLTQALKQ